MKKKFSENYRLGFDFWALILYALLLLPSIIYWCMPAFSGMSAGWLSVVSHVLCALSAIPLIFLLRREKEKKPLFDTAFTTLSMLVLLYLASWIIFFCGKTNFAVTFFVMISPSLAMLVMALERRNLFAVPISFACFIFSLVAALQVGFSL